MSDVTSADLQTTLINPYAPNEAVDLEESSATSATKVPAILLVLLLIPTLYYDAEVAYGYTKDLLNALPILGWSLSSVRRWDWLIRGVVISSIHLFILFGAIKLWRCRSYWIAVTACVLSLIPILTPSLILGIPVAAWALVVLYRTEVINAFQKNKT